MTTAEDRESDAELLRAIGHAVRLEILAALADTERSVGDIEALTGIAQPGLSQQLGVLRKAELVETRREGKQVFYSAVPERLAAARDVIAVLIPAMASPKASLAKLDREKRDPIHRKGGAAVFARVTD